MLLMRSFRGPTFTYLTATTALLVLCVNLLKDVSAGMKGKGGRQGHIIIQNEVKDRPGVPIYMPIPIPIPMPMGPSGGGKFHSHHFQQQQHRDHEGEGEVKKIYLLQPMPKVVPQPHLKGGGLIAPVQNHIHMQPVQHSKTTRHHSSSKAHEGHEEPTKHGKSSHSSSDIKILPIVVIPPIAPMPPIHVPPSSNIHTPRMTLTPQFNNYVVSALDDKRNPYSSRVAMLQDHKSFSDYGSGASVYRSSRSRGRPKQGRLSRPVDYGQAATRSRSRVFDDYGDDYDYPQSSTSWRQNNYHDNGERRSSRRNYHLDQTGSWRSRSPSRSLDSIRDVLDQQISFDDDLPSDSGENRDATQVGGGDCCVESRKSRIQIPAPSSVDKFDNYVATSNQEHRDMAYKDYDDQKNSANPITSSRFSSSNLDSDAETSVRDLDRESHSTRQRPSDLSSVYYDRQLDQPQQTRSNSRLSYVGNSNKSKRLYLDEREIFNDDEWLFDTVKSVTHSNPNHTNTTTTMQALSTNNDSATSSTKKSTTIIPPSSKLLIK